MKKYLFNLLFYFIGIISVNAEGAAESFGNAMAYSMAAENLRRQQQQQMIELIISIVGILLIIIIVPIVVFKTTKKCPYCDTRVSKNAIVCKHCKKDIK